MSSTDGSNDNGVTDPEAPVGREGAAEENPGPLDPDQVWSECEVEFVRGSGPGGQHRNRRETGVRLTHGPSGLVVVATERRSQAENRRLALERLVARLEERRRRPKPRRATRKSRSVRNRERQWREKESAKRRGRSSPERDE